jgi:thiol-disulfide isomerase/thioredoxin
MKNVILTFVIISLVSVGFVYLASQNPTAPSTKQNDTQDIGTDSDDTRPTDTDGQDPKSVKWTTFKLQDILTGENFKISDHGDKPILIESFAVWCPTCKKQQDEIKKLHENIGDDFVSISLDTDPNEDASQVKSYTKKHGYDWLYAVSPPSLTQSLIDTFGVQIVNAPSAPVVLLCQDGSSKLLQSGLKSASTLQNAINSCT